MSDKNNPKINITFKDLSSLRYVFEHKLIPNWFYANTDDFIEKIKSDNKMIDKIFFSICTEEKLLDVWTDCYVSKYVKEDELEYIMITCPEQIQTTQCNIIILIWNDKTKRVFNIEYTDVNKILFGSDEPGYMLCSWDPNGIHDNYGNIDLKLTDCIKKIKKLFTAIVPQDDTK